MAIGAKNYGKFCNWMKKKKKYRGRRGKGEKKKKERKRPGNHLN